jgi:hypothetical protein
MGELQADKDSESAIEQARGRTFESFMGVERVSRLSPPRPFLSQLGPAIHHPDHDSGIRITTPAAERDC